MCSWHKVETRGTSMLIVAHNLIYTAMPLMPHRSHIAHVCGVALAVIILEIVIALRMVSITIRIVIYKIDQIPIYSRLSIIRYTQITDISAIITVGILLKLITIITDMESVIFSIAYLQHQLCGQHLFLFQAISQHSQPKGLLPIQRMLHIVPHIIP